MENENSKIKKLFPLELLQAPPGNKGKGLSEAEIIQRKEDITMLLKEYGILVNDIVVKEGPSKCLFRVTIPSTTKMSAIKELESDPPLGFVSNSARITTNFWGSAIDIEFPKESPEQVLMREALESEDYLNSSYELPCVIGKSYDGYFVFDLAKIHHVLIGESIGFRLTPCLHSIITSLLYSRLPSELKFVLIAPYNQSHFQLFDWIGQRYLATLTNNESAVITEPSKGIEALKAVCEEMEARYDLLKTASCRHFSEYNQKIRSGQIPDSEICKQLPYWVVIISEFADLKRNAGGKYEMPLIRIAESAHKVGIHLIIATESPSFHFVTGRIKANFPGRIAVGLLDEEESLVILDSDEGETQFFDGDMLFSNGAESIRIQATNIEEDEVKAVVEYLNGQGNLI